MKPSIQQMRGRAEQILDRLHGLDWTQHAPVPLIDEVRELGGPDQIPALAVGLEHDAPEIRYASARALIAILGRNRGVDPGPLAAHARAALRREAAPQVGVVLLALLVRLGERVPLSEVERAIGVSFARGAMARRLGQLLRARAGHSGR